MNYKCFSGKTAVITGGSKGIGRCICEKLTNAGAVVYSIDSVPAAPLSCCNTFIGDVGEEDTLKSFALSVLKECKSVDIIINNAPPVMKGLEGCTYDEFNYALRVGVTAPFMLVKLLCGAFCPGASVVNISSTRDRMSQPNTESYSAAKGGISALTHALAITLSGRARVNSISPGWIDCGEANHSMPDIMQHPAGRIGNPEDIANIALFLCSDAASFITGENITADGGMTKLMIYTGDNGWSYEY